MRECIEEIPRACVPASQQARDWLEIARNHGLNTLRYVVGLWPLVAVAGLAGALLLSSLLRQSP